MQNGRSSSSKSRSSNTEKTSDLAHYSTVFYPAPQWIDLKLKNKNREMNLCERATCFHPRVGSLVGLRPTTSRTSPSVSGTSCPEEINIIVWANSQNWMGILRTFLACCFPLLSGFALLFVAVTFLLSTTFFS